MCWLLQLLATRVQEEEAERKRLLQHASDSLLMSSFEFVELQPEAAKGHIQSLKAKLASGIGASKKFRTFLADYERMA